MENRAGPEILTLSELRAICPRLSAAKAAEYLPHLRAAMVEAEITTPVRVAAFLAQLAHESGEFRYWVELGDYCENYDTGKLAQRLGNTPEPDGDGCVYKGRGPIQITGLDGYRAAGKALGLPLVEHPELAALPEHGFRIAAWYWTTRKLNALADAGDFRTVTIRINGGLNGWDDRVRYWDRAKKVLGVRAAA